MLPFAGQQKGAGGREENKLVFRRVEILVLFTISKKEKKAEGVKPSPDGRRVRMSTSRWVAP
jgi:hypothetical protein